jgi:hypothetical protein
MQAYQAALRRLLGSPTSPITGTSVLPRFVHSDQASAQHTAQETMTAQGYDPASFWEQSVVWGDQDPFQYESFLHAQLDKFIVSP